MIRKLHCNHEIAPCAIGAIIQQPNSLATYHLFQAPFIALRIYTKVPPLSIRTNVYCLVDTPVLLYQ